jgi:hypothetical protein
MPIIWALDFKPILKLRGFKEQHGKHYENKEDEMVKPALLLPQKLDHFNDSDSRIWYQTYYMNTDYYQPGKC